MLPLVADSSASTLPDDAASDATPSDAASTLSATADRALGLEATVRAEPATSTFESTPTEAPTPRLTPEDSPAATPRKAPAHVSRAALSAPLRRGPPAAAAGGTPSTLRAEAGAPREADGSRAAAAGVRARANQTDRSRPAAAAELEPPMWSGPAGHRLGNTARRLDNRARRLDKEAPSSQTARRLDTSFQCLPVWFFTRISTTETPSRQTARRLDKPRAV